MARSQIDNTRLPPTGPHLRYVECYAVGADPSQPVTVKSLKWDGSAFVTFGDAYKVGDVDSKKRIRAGMRFWVIWERASRRWLVVVTEQYRALRGTWYSGTSTLMVNNIVPLDHGADPRTDPTDAAEFVAVVNVAGDTYTGGDRVYADYNRAASQWEARPKGGGGGSEKYRLIRGQCVGGVAADATSFKIDNIVVLSGGLDPRAVAGDMAEQLWVTNAQKETFVDDEYVCAIYFDTGFGTGWQTLLAERPRAIRGTWYSGSGTLQIKNVVPLCAGLDPRTDPADSDEIVDVINTPGDTYSSGDKVYADWDATSEVWEARPKSRNGGVATVTIKVPTAISITAVGTSIQVKLDYAEYSVLAKDLGSSGNLTGTLSLTPTTIKNPTAIHLSYPSSTSLEAELDYTPRTIYIPIAASDGAAGNLTDTISGTDCG